LEEFVPRSHSSEKERGSSLFIRRVADLEEKKNEPEHFQDAAGVNIEMSDHSFF
jgi:hypothetical protein